jgi:hypothetical protein
MSKVGAMRPFALGHQDLDELAGIRVNAKEVERQSHIDSVHCGVFSYHLFPLIAYIRFIHSLILAHSYLTASNY